MNDSDVWSVDQVDASQLLTSLGIEPTPAAIEKVARAFAQCRTTAHHWAAKRTRANAIEALEAASLAAFTKRSSEWADGFRAAENTILVATSDELLATSPPAPHSRETHLRRLFRDRVQAEQH